jgi:superfamily II DNA or RNA helicase
MQDLQRAPRAPAPGTVVAARGRHWRVVDTETYEDCVQVRVAPLNHAGPAATFLQPFDCVEPVAVSDRPRRASRRRTAEAAAAALLDSHPWTGLRAALAANIRLLPHQLEPALAIFSGQTKRILLADDVGLGKTIQAGLVLAELRARHELTRALIVTPAGLRDQWEGELGDRFDLPVRRVDAGALSQAGRTLPPWTDFWSLPAITVLSIDLLKRPEVCAQVRQTVWDLVIVDEAHHARTATDRGAAAALVCGRARHVVLISATPHGGDRAAFEGLLDLGRLTPSEPGMRVFHRTRGAVSPGVAPRRTRNVNVRVSAAERRLFAILDRYTSRVWRESQGRAAGADARLAMIVLRKRALSSAASLARSVSRRLMALAGHEPFDDRTQLALGFEDTLDGELIADDAEPGPVLNTPGLDSADDERRLLARVLTAAHEASRDESKRALLTRTLSRTREPVIVFTEYRDSLEEIARALGAHGVTYLHGGLMPAARRAAVDAFTTGRARVLLATDAAAEGLNLHHRCRWVVHYELPWNPVRLEQRTGRVDRLGQARRVHAWRLIGAGTDESRILLHLEQRAASSEEEVARAVFEGAPAGAEHRAAGPGHRAVSADAVREAARLQHLRVLRRFQPRPSLRPLVSRARARGAFTGFSRRTQLAVCRAHAFDGGGRRVAEWCRAIVRRRGPLAPSGRNRPTPATPSTGLRREIARHRAWARQGIDRDESLAAALSGTCDGPLQPSLFDRRAERAFDRRRARSARAVDEVEQHRQRLVASLERNRVGSRLVAVFEIR